MRRKLTYTQPSLMPREYPYRGISPIPWLQELRNLKGEDVQRRCRVDLMKNRDGMTIDQCITSFPCANCGAEVGEPCTVRGVYAPLAEYGPQRYAYHAKRTDAGAKVYNAGNQVGEDE